MQKAYSVFDMLKQRLQQHHKLLVVVCFAMLFIAFTLATWCGLGKTTDSHKYLATAENLLARGQFITLNEEAYTFWPPLFPISLALLPARTSLLIGLVNSICLVGTLLFWHRIAKEYLTQLWQLFFLFTLCSSTPILMVHVFVWSEPIFLFALSGYLFSMYFFMKTEQRKWLVWASFSAFFMLLQRNAGIMLLGGMSLGFLFFDFLTVKKHLKQLLLHGIASVSGWGCWQYWQYILQDHRESIDYFLFNEVDWLKYEAFFKAWYTHWIPLETPELGAAIGFIILAFAFFILSKQVLLDTFQKSLWCMIIIYVALLLALPFTTNRDAIRYQAIFIPPLFLNSIYVLQKSIQQLPSTKKRIALLAIVTWSFYPAARLFWNSLRWHSAFCGDAALF